MSSYALMQTAHTQPARELRLKAGLANVHNAIDNQLGRSFFTNTTQELGLRLGVADFMDLGLSPFMGTGASVDAKANLLDNRQRAAFGPRLLTGYAFGSERGVFSVEVGVIGSYRVVDWLEPYAGLSFANHWFSGENRDLTAELAFNQRFATRRGYGDGLIKSAFGVDLRIATHVHGLLEYGHWFVAQNDPGDGYGFLANDNLSVSIAWQ